jgi:hypothetical protein
LVHSDAHPSDISITYSCHFQLKQGRKRLIKGTRPTPLSTLKSNLKKATKIPPATKLLSLAHYYKDLLAASKVKDYAELARLTQVSRARLTQIMNLTFLAPEIQKALLCAPFYDHKKTERSLREIAECLSWQVQLEKWNS